MKLIWLELTKDVLNNNTTSTSSIIYIHHIHYIHRIHHVTLFLYRCLGLHILQRRIIYMTTHILYRPTVKKENAWSAVSTEVGVGGELLLMLIKLFSRHTVNPTCFLCFPWGRKKFLSKVFSPPKFLSHNLRCWSAAVTVWLLGLYSCCYVKK